MKFTSAVEAKCGGNSNIFLENVPCFCCLFRNIVTSLSELFILINLLQELMYLMKIQFPRDIYRSVCKKHCKITGAALIFMGSYIQVMIMTYQMYVPIILCVDVYGMVQTLRELNIYCVLGRMECQRFILNILIYRFVYPTTIIFVSHLLMCHFRGRN